MQRFRRICLTHSSSIRSSCRFVMIVSAWKDNGVIVASKQAYVVAAPSQIASTSSKVTTRSFRYMLARWENRRNRRGTTYD